ncbi:synaptotagmin-6 isoform X3 [Leopardus geoffroyi]|uniref:synaptotagmin-6 isoform X3 n=1 Tax=Leopardus geoffroyi TaxID=46844 RepID=UPI001E25DBB0|nr:synaptotagmin-6 isoform X3 [Leopardus geoffroyi]
MSGVWGTGGPRCQAALAVLASLCRARPPPLGLDVETCRSFELQPPERSPSAADTGTSVSLLAVVVIVCGVALVAVFLFLFWKLCWMPWRNKEASSPTSASPPPEAPQSPSSGGNMADKLKDTNSLGFLEAAVKISHTSPDIPAEVQMSVKEHIMRHTRLQRQTTEPASSTRHTSFKRHLPRQMHVSSVDYGNELPPAAEQPTSIGRIKPELYKQKSVDGDDAKSEAAKSCGKLNFSLRYDYESETLIVRILRAFDLPAKDFCGSSDPYVKIYLLPDRKRKLQTRVHRKTLNPTFDENFHFPVPYEELADRKLHLSVFDFDRFSRHDMIGEVILDNLFEASDLSRETSIWKDIQYATSESVDLGEIMFSLCYLPTAGRLTLTVIKCRNLKAMDITGYSDPYVKVSLLCDGRRLKKKKTTIKKNTLNPVYNEAIIFDIPPENMDQVNLLISVMDYDRGRAGLPALTVRAPARPRNHLPHHELRGRATPRGLRDVLFCTCSTVQTQCCAGAAAAVARVLTAPV